VYKDWQETAGKFYSRAYSLFSTRNSTPEVSALMDVMSDVSKQPQQRKVVLWIGDGDAYNAEAIHAVRKRYPDVIVIAIGLGVDLSNYFDHAVRVNDSRELASTSFRAVSKALAA
jgi:cobalamin biosynthesis protein CobT